MKNSNLKRLFCSGYLSICCQIILWSQPTDSCKLTPPFVNASTGITKCLSNENCNPIATRVGDPYIYTGECHIGLNRYLSRSIDVGGLHHMLYNNGTSNAMDCTQPYNHLNGIKFCPCEYCNLIKSLVDMNIQLVQRAYWGGADHEHQFFPGDSYYELGKQIIKDINYAYDCAGKRRPIIQGSGFDTANPKNFQFARIYDNDIDSVQIDRNIPTWIIDLYFEEFSGDIDEIDPHFPTSNPEPSNSPLLGCYLEDDTMVHDDDYEKSFRNYYFNPDGTTKNCLFFRRERICGDTVSIKIDIQYLEARMWLLYEACAQIDMGYTSLHMGVYWDYSGSELGSYDRLYQLTNAIRAYAKKVPGRFVVLSGEPPMQDKDNGRTAIHTVHGVDHFIFDFDSRAMRPREISDNPYVSGDGPQVSGDGGENPPGICDDPIDPQVLEDFFLHSPCANTPFPAVIDPCTINSFGGTTSGIHPLSGCHMDVLPYTVHFDGFSDPVNPGVASNGNSSLTWGYHDHQWFTLLDTTCQRWWFDYFYCNRRKYHDGNGFVVIPGILFFDSNLTDSTGDGARHLISDDPGLVDSIKNTIAPTLALPAMDISEKCFPGNCVSVCNGEPASVGKLWLTGSRCYTIKVVNEDCSSVYSIHIQGPNQEWYPQVLGNTREFCPTVSGQYKIGIRQDNLGLPTSTMGTQEKWDSMTLNPICCIKLVTTCTPAMIISDPECVQEDEYKRTYSFALEAPSIGDVVSNIRMAKDFYSFRNLSQPTPRKYTGLVDVWNEDVSDLEIFVDVTSNALVETNLYKKPLPSCGQLGHRSERKVSNLSGRILLFPNPVSKLINLEYWSDNDEEVDLVVLNSLDQVQYSVSWRASEGKNLWNLDVDNLPTGGYMISVSSEKYFGCKKFIKTD